MLARRLLILLAVMMGLTALAAGVAPRAPVDRGSSGASARPAGPVPAPIERTLQTSRSGQLVEARLGQLVVIHVEAHALDTVSLAEYDNEPVEPDSPARFELLADVPGTYPIELLESEREIGRLVVAGGDEPAS